MPSGPVLYILKRFPRLSETFILRELLALEARGERILIEVLLPPEDGPRHRELTSLRAEVRYVPRRPRLRHPPVTRAHLRVGLRQPLRWARLARAARRGESWRRFLQAGVVADRARRTRTRHLHAHFATAATEVARDAAALAGLPFTVTAHAKDIFHADNAPLLVERVAGASAVITVSRFNAAHLRRVLPDTPVHHIPNGLSLGPAVTARTGGSVLCVARLVPKKGVDVLLEASARLNGDVPKLRVEIAGTGPLAAELEEQALRLGLAERVRFLGALPHEAVQAAFERCSMLVLPARVAPDGDRDAMPTVLVEAMARGLPVVSTALVGIPEIVRHEETGLLVAPDDPDALAAAIRRLLSDHTLARRLGQRGRALVAKELDPDRSARLLGELFASAP